MKTFQKILAAVLATVLFMGCFLPNAFAAGKKITAYNVGDIVEFGWYPQSEVTDENMVAALNRSAGVDSSNVAESTSVANGWISYNYYSGTGNYDDGQMTASDYMRYTDIRLGSDLYRGVIFDSYRPGWTGYDHDNNTQHQDDNGYNKNTVYWFKYEPIKWRVLDSATGMAMSETILDAQPYNNYMLYSGGEFYGDAAKTYYANNYEKSSIRAWLNRDFYNTAFCDSQKDMIVTTNLDNSAYDTSYSKYDTATTNDKIYLLSYADVLNTSYGFSSSTEDNEARTAQGSDYAKSQGLWVVTAANYSYSGNSPWRLRSAGSYAGWYSFFTCDVDIGGEITYYYYAGGNINGIRPALNFNPKAEIVQCKVTDLENSDTNNQNLPDLLEWLESLSDKLKSFFRTIIEWLKSLLGV